MPTGTRNWTSLRTASRPRRSTSSAQRARHQDGGGFKIGLTPDGSDLAISPGRIYVDGVLCELDPCAVPVKISGAKATLEALTLDGRVLAKGEWVEILYPDGKVDPRKIADLDTPSHTLALEGGPVAPDPEARPAPAGHLCTRSICPGRRCRTRVTMP